MTQRKKPRLALTMGDVNGVGPEILARALARPEVRTVCEPIVYGCGDVLARACTNYPGAPTPHAVGSAGAAAPANRQPVYNAGHAAPPLQPGKVVPAAGAAAVSWIQAAVQDSIDGVVDGLVTCPISKTCIYQAGFHYTGHTELVAEMTNSPDYRMCLFAGAMRAVHITSHMALANALRAVTRPRIEKSVHIAHTALVRMGIPSPRVAVAGLNPHAGEDGAFGREEIDIIAPAVAACCEAGIACVGPIPPDTIFRHMREGRYDVVIALYHDQGHIPLKLIAMDTGVNVTLGIPIVRTSVDHGTAYDIAWQGQARAHSLVAAITLAAQLTGMAMVHPPAQEHSEP
ncbi:MAG: 4-hydroxythreonine-4-phosphate dehydrogenase PdxA [Candidatus Hydrogenedentota bacterium]